MIINAHMVLVSPTGTASDTMVDPSVGQSCFVTVPFWKFWNSDQPRRGVGPLGVKHVLPSTFGKVVSH